MHSANRPLYQLRSGQHAHRQRGEGWMTWDMALVETLARCEFVARQTVLTTAHPHRIIRWRRWG